MAWNAGQGAAMPPPTSRGGLPPHLQQFQPAPAPAPRPGLPPTSGRFSAAPGGAQLGQVPKAMSKYSSGSSLSTPSKRDGGPQLSFYENIKRSLSRHVLLVLGTFILCLVILLPCWDAGRLLYDPVYVYFLGRSLPVWVIMFCVLMVFVFIIAMLSVISHTREEVRTTTTLMMVFGATLTTLGLGLLLLSVPIKERASAVYDDLLENCARGSHTKDLYNYHSVLLNMRRQAACSGLRSVEECDGFQDSQPYTGFLKNLELELKCSGFCYHSSTTGANSTEAAAALLQTSASRKPVAEALHRLAAKNAGTAGASPTSHEGTQSRRKARTLFLLTTNASMSKVPYVEDDDDVAQEREGRLSMLAAKSSAFRNRLQAAEQYPPTLFTDANFQASCDGMAAHRLQAKAIDAAFLMYSQGVTLLCTAVALYFFQLMGKCRMGYTLSWQGAGKTVARRRPGPGPQEVTL